MRNESTVGTITEIYDYLRLLYARIGIQHCFGCGGSVQRQTVQQIVDTIVDDNLKYKKAYKLIPGKYLIGKMLKRKTWNKTKYIEFVCGYCNWCKKELFNTMGGWIIN